MIDSHCHLDHEPLFNNLNSVIERSKNVGIEKMLTICTTKKSFQNIIKLLDLTFSLQKVYSPEIIIIVDPIKTGISIVSPNTSTPIMLTKTR